MAPRPTFTVDPENILRSVDIVLQVMANFSKQYDGLFPAVADRQGCRMLMDFPLPAPIPGQRNSDRSPRGCNLAHDIGLLATLDGLARALDRPRYALLRENYLQTFATVCAPASPTGLLPWGEHSYWDLQRGGRIGNSYLLQYGDQPLDAPYPTHHQLGILPLGDWEVIHAANPRVIPRFVDGLDWHWDESHTLFNRHAPITQFIRIDGAKRGHDFPGAAGRFIHDYAVALALVEEPKPAWREQMMAFCDSWWHRRLDSGLCPKSGGDDPLKWNGPALGQTLNLAGALLAAAEVLRERQPELADVLHERGASFTRALLDVPQPHAEEGGYCRAFNRDGSPFKVSQPWAGNRGHGITAKTVLPLLDAAVRIGDDRGLALAERCAAIYRKSFLPRDLIVRAGDLGAVIGLTTELYRITGEQGWLDVALAHATNAMELFFDSPLPRAAWGRRHYESQQGSSVLVHALARLVLVARGKDCPGGLERPMA
jgi:hypothetical protein